MQDDAKQSAGMGGDDLQPGRDMSLLSTTRVRYLLEIIAATLILSGLSLISIQEYLLFHSIVELVTIAIAFAIFIIIWNTRDTLTDTFFLIIGITFLFTGSIDLLHTLAFKGMGVFPGSTTDLPTQLWIAARYFQSLAFLAATLCIGRSISKNRKYDAAIIFSACTAVILLLLASIFVWHNFPACYIDGTGLTTFKIASEYVISLILVATAVLLYIRRRNFDDEVWRFLIAAQFFLILGELAFTSYVSVYGFMNMLGHLFKLLSFYFFYRAIIVVAFRRPVDLLFRRLKENEEILRESGEKYRAFFSTSMDCVFITTRDGSWMDFNDAAVTFFGYGSREELSGVKIGELYAEPSGRAAHTRHIIETGYSFEYPVFLKKKDGTVMNTLITSVARKDREGTIIGFQGTIRNITDRKRDEDALRLQNRIFETIAEGVFLIRISDGTIVYTNEKFDRMFRYAKGELIGRHVSVVNAPEEGTGFQDTTTRVMAALHETGEWRGELKNITKDGTVFWSLAVVSTFEHPEFGRVWISAHTDITGRKRVEDAFRESEKRYRDMFEINNAVMLIIDPETGKIVDANSAACRYYGYTREEITGLVITQINSQDPDTTRDDLARARGSTGAVFQFRHRKKDGELRDVEVFSGPVLLGGRRLLHSIVQDVTDRKRVEAAVESAVKLNQLIDTVSISECMTFTLDEAQRLTSSKIGFFHFVNHDEKTIQLMTWSTETKKHCFIPKNPEKNYPVEKGGVWLEALRERRPVIHNDYASQPHKKGLPEGHVPVIRELVVPIFYEDRIVAIIGVGNKARDYDERDINVLSLLAKNTWTLIQRKRAEEALRESEQKFRDIFNNTTDAIHIHEIRDDGSPGNFTDVNDVSCRMLGYTREEMLTMTPLDIATEYHNPPLAQIFESQRTLGMARFETKHRTKDGRTIPVEVNTHVVTIQGRNVMLGVVRDITERKKAEALLQDFNQKLGQQVQEQTKEINASLNEKVLLLREIHHRVKNNLQIIISLVNLQMRQIDDVRLKQVMMETQNRVRAMSLVHEKLYQSEDIAHINLADYTRFLTSQLFSFYGVNSGQVKLQIDIGRIMLDINTAIPVGLIINELASNALKHAFPDNREGEFSITAREEGRELFLTVRDNGIGLPEDLAWRDSRTLGFRLVVSLVDQLDGTIDLDRTAGTAFTIVVMEKVS